MLGEILTGPSVTRSLADHAELTALSYRQNILSDASVLQVSSLSPTVKGYRLRVEDPRLTFRAGQWLASYPYFSLVEFSV